jgi:phosphopantetheinyl transferase
VHFTQQYIQLKDIDIHLLNFSEFETSDYLDQLTDAEKERFYTFNSAQRKLEYVATRILRHRIFGFEHIHYDKNGAPFIEGEGYISISHTKNQVGIAFSKKHAIGLDLEMIQEKAKKVCSKFLTSDELLSFDANSELEMTKAWSAKEALYKLAGRKELNFKTDLHLKKVTESEWIGKISHASEEWCVELNTFVLENFVVSVNTSAKKKI